jgi:hypothetical protein
MTNCGQCGKKLGLFEKRFNSNNGEVLCISCNEVYSKKQHITEFEIEKITWSEDRVNLIKRMKIEAEMERNYLKDHPNIIRPNRRTNIHKTTDEELRGIAIARNAEKEYQKIRLTQENKLREKKLIDEMSWQSFEDTIIKKLGAIKSNKRSGDLGIDGTKDGVPIQIKQSKGIGRNVVDNFETAIRRYYPRNATDIRGIIIAKSFTKGAYDEVRRAKIDHNIDIKLMIVDELLK